MLSFKPKYLQWLGNEVGKCEKKKKQKAETIKLEILSMWTGIKSLNFSWDWPCGSLTPHCQYLEFSRKSEI